MSTEEKKLTANSKKISFISEGVTDIENQKAREQTVQNKYEDEQKRRERKSLRSQLRSNAISKQKQYNYEVKQRDGFNRLSASEVKFYKDIKDNENAKELELTEHLNLSSSSYDKKKKQLLWKEVLATGSAVGEIIHSDPLEIHLNSRVKQKSRLGIVQKNKDQKKKKIKVKLPFSLH